MLNYELKVFRNEIITSNLHAWHQSEEFSIRNTELNEEKKNIPFFLRQVSWNISAAEENTTKFFLDLIEFSAPNNT